MSVIIYGPLSNKKYKVASRLTAGRLANVLSDRQLVI